MKTLVRAIWKGDSRAIFKGVYEVGDLGVTVATSLLLSYNAPQSAGSLSILLESAKAPALSYEKGHTCLSGQIQRRLGPARSNEAKHEADMRGGST
jgi:hypothetical protein